MEQYLIKRKKNGQKRGRVVQVRKPTYWKTFRYDRLALIISLFIATVILFFTIESL